MTHKFPLVTGKTIDITAVYDEECLYGYNVRVYQGVGDVDKVSPLHEKVFSGDELCSWLWDTRNDMNGHDACNVVIASLLELGDISPFGKQR